MLHPVIRVATLLVMATTTALGDALHVLGMAALVALAYVLTPGVALGPALLMLRRMRWFFVSLALLFFWFTPGAPLVAEWAAVPWAPSIEGLRLGLTRIAALLIIVFAVTLLLQTTNRQELVRAIIALGWPLPPGLRARLAVRMTLVLENVAAVQALVENERPLTGNTDGGAVAAWAAGAGRVFGAVIARAEAAPLAPIVVPTAAAVPALQWLVPLALVVVAVW